MADSLRIKKLQYSKVLERYNGAEKWLDSPERTEKEVERWMPEFYIIVSTLNLLLEAIGEHTTDEAVSGFKVS